MFNQNSLNRKHIIDDTGDHFLIVDSAQDLSMTPKQTLKMKEQLKRTSHYMTGKGRYYPAKEDEQLEPQINLII